MKPAAGGTIYHDGREDKKDTEGQGLPWALTGFPTQFLANMMKGFCEEFPAIPFNLSLIFYGKRREDLFPLNRAGGEFNSSLVVDFRLYLGVH